MLASRFIYGCRMASSGVPIQVTRIGLIGLGNVGSALAKNLARSKQYKLVAVLDKQVEKATFLPPEVVRCAHARDVVEQSDTVITALPIPAVVQEVMESDNGVISGLVPGQTWIDHSTTDYEQTLRLADAVSAKGAHPLEAPVTGGITLLKQGKMTVMVGGEYDVFSRCKPLLEMSCKNVLYMGKMGSATITKVISNMLAGANTVLMGEAMMMAKRSGLDLKSFFDGIRLSAGNSYVWETEGPLVLNGTFDPDFAIALHCKDFSLGNRIAEKCKSPIPILGLIEHIYKNAKFRYGDNVGSSYPAKMIQDDVGESLQVDGFDKWMYSIEMVSGGSIGVVHTTKEEDET